MSVSDDPPISQRQVQRISDTHGGFLYQHVLGAQCLLGMAAGMYDQLVVERDEDLELVVESGRWYLQVKNLGRALTKSAIKSSLQLFVKIRERHASNERAGTPRFFVLSSSDPGPGLKEALGSDEWPDDIEVVSPSRSTPLLPFSLAQNVASQFSSLTASTYGVQLSRAAPETLAWKLTAFVQALATGQFRGGRRDLRRDELVELLEQQAALVDSLPEPPAPYHPHENEPPIERGLRVRLVVGPSGSGKTSWAAQAAIHTPHEIVYARALESPKEGVQTWIASHIAARLYGKDHDLGHKLFLPGALRLLDERIQSDSRSALVVIDDAHNLPADALLASIRSTPSLRWLFVGRRSPSISELASKIPAEVEELQGWPLGTIAEVALQHGAACSPQVANRVRVTTGGAPLMVENIAKLGAAAEGGIEGFIRRLEQGLHSETTALEHVLRAGVWSQLGDLAIKVAASLSALRTSLPWSAVLQLTQVVGSVNKVRAAYAARELREWRVTNSAEEGYRLHDSFRPLGVQARAELTEDELKAAAALLRGHLERELQTDRSATKLLDYLRALSELGEFSTLIDIASGAEERFREYGLTNEVEDLLEAAILSGTGSGSDRFLAADSLAFLALSRDDEKAALKWIELLEACLDRQIIVDASDQSRVSVKHIILAGLQGNYQRAVSAAEEALRWTPKYSLGGRVLRYNLAVSAWRTGHFEAAAKELFSLVAEYMSEFGLSAEQVFTLEINALAQLLDRRVGVDTLRWAADCWFLLAQVLMDTGEPAIDEFDAATKLYILADAPASMLKGAFEVADQLLWRVARPESAVRILSEIVIPSLEASGLYDSLLEVRSLLAVAFACHGEFAEAVREIESLKPFYSSMADSDLAVVLRREEITRGLCSGELRYANGLLLDREGRPRFTEIEQQHPGQTPME